MICASLVLLQIMFAVHRFAQEATAASPLRVVDCRSAAMLIKSALRIYLSVSYGMIGILRIGSLRSPPPYPAAPDFPLCRGQNKTPRDNLLINTPLEMTVATDSGHPPADSGQLPLTSCEIVKKYIRYFFFPFSPGGKKAFILILIFFFPLDMDRRKGMIFYGILPFTRSFYEIHQP